MESKETGDFARWQCLRFLFNGYVFLTIIVKYSPYLCIINKNKGTMSKSEKIAASLRIADNMMHRASTGSDFEKLSEMMSDEMLKLIDEMGLVLA